ncbi:MAG: hypothetical protein EFKGCFLK_01785 [Rhodocyclaceae bacterium]|nr:hypothetical protein [Rhodocyclaceae bacterium]
MQLLQFIENISDQHAQVDGFRLHVAAGDPGEREHVVDDLLHAMRSGANARDVSLSPGVDCGGVILLDHSRKAVYGAQRCGEVVRDGIAEGLKLPVGGSQFRGALGDAQFQTFVEPADLGLGPLALADVESQADEELSFAPPDRRGIQKMRDQAAIGRLEGRLAMGDDVALEGDAAGMTQEFRLGEEIADRHVGQRIRGIAARDLEMAVPAQQVHVRVEQGKSSRQAGQQGVGEILFLPQGDEDAMLLRQELPDLLLGDLLRMDVAQRAGKAHGASGFVARGLAAAAKPAKAAVAAAQPVACIEGRAVRDGSVQRGDGLRTVLFVQRGSEGETLMELRLVVVAQHFLETTGKEGHVFMRGPVPESVGRPVNHAPQPLLAVAQFLDAFLQLVCHGIERLPDLADLVLLAVPDAGGEFSLGESFAGFDQACQPARHAEGEEDGQEDGQRQAEGAGGEHLADEFLAPLPGVGEGEGEVQGPQLLRAEHHRRDDIVARTPGEIERCTGFRKGLRGIPVRRGNRFALQIAQHEVVDVAVVGHVAQELIECGVVALRQRQGKRCAEQGRELSHLVPDAVLRAAVDDVEADPDDQADGEQQHQQGGDEQAQPEAVQAQPAGQGVHAMSVTLAGELAADLRQESVVRAELVRLHRPQAVELGFLDEAASRLIVAAEIEQQPGQPGMRRQDDALSGVDGDAGDGR